MVAWATDADVTAALGTTAVDAAWLTACTDAANTWAFRKRAEAGYADDPTVAPDGAVALGAALYGAALYQSRGGGDAAVSFDQADQLRAEPLGGLGHILRLLAVGKADVA
jgi:hypothetical protein